MDQPLREAIRRYGSLRGLARALGIKHPSISSWTATPANRVLDIERLSGVPRHRLRPDLYPDAVDADAWRQRAELSEKLVAEHIQEIKKLRRLLASLKPLVAPAQRRAPAPHPKPALAATHQRQHRQP